MRAMTTHLLTLLPAVIAASFIQPDVPELPVAGKVIHGLQPRNDHILATTRSEISMVNSNSACVFISTKLGQEVLFARVRKAAPQFRDARRGVRASGRAFSSAPLPVFFPLIVNITGGQRKGLPVGVTGRRQGLKHHRSGECADERLDGG